MEQKVYAVMMSWDNDGEIQSYIERVFSTAEKADKYAEQRFEEELRQKPYTTCSEDEIAIDRLMLTCSIIDDAYWFEFAVCERTLE